MNFNEIIEISKKRSEAGIKEIRDQLSLPFFKIKDQPVWDNTPRRIVVIGSGIGGMASGALFAKAGHKVNVLEMNKELIGGHGRCLTFGGMTYSMGPQYVWEFGEGYLGDRFMKFLDIKAANPFIPMESDGFERFFIGGKNEKGNCCLANFKVPLGLGNFHRDLKALFPEEGDSLDALFNEMISIYDTYKSFFKEHSFTEGRFLLATKFLATSKIPMSMKVKIGRCLTMSVREFFDEFHVTNLLRRILYGHGGIFAENESEMSAIAYIVGTGNYHMGAWYPEKGFAYFFDSLSSVIKKAGGSVETGKKVVRLETRDNLVIGAICEDGSSYECDFVFSDISPRLTYSLLGKPTEYFDYTPSHSIPTCCLGIKGGLQSIADMKGRNYWWQDGNEVDYKNPDVTAPPKMLFIGSPSANGYGRVGDTNNDALVVFCPGNYQQEKTIYEEGPKAVGIFKKKLACDIVDILEMNVFPGIKSKMLFAEIVSSVDIKTDTDGELGNAYGRRLTVKELLKGAIDEKDCPQNLFNVSATKNSPGIAAGIFTAELILNELTGIEF
ncbi:MAG TPA: NAD(P)-binding protein [Smithella sp.]|nr:NAD(P)-binding protein [Smithella sp.]